ncbi:MAG: DegT/DnrJ/EryC1/StrS aminotransferase family protein, partial [Actinobacteria bacterium]|nr:DegT/DnrJ/EryC1/StrS aminotransferase family protein [Actinomycetota bacterium]
ALHEAREAPRRVVLPVHYAGHPCDMQTLLKSAGSVGAAVVEDAAHALGAAYGDMRVGAQDASATPRLTCFSFYATKNLATGEGGMLVGDADLLGRSRRLAMHGMTRPSWQRYAAGGSWQYEVVEPGYKYNMPDLQAAIGIHQLRKFDTFQRRREEVADVYSTRFRSVPGVTLPQTLDGYTHALHLYPLRLRLDQLSISRAQFIEELTARNIGTSVHFIPIHLHPYYREKYGWVPEDFPHATAEYQGLVSLPIYPKMTDRDVDDVCSAVEEVIRMHAG